MAAPVEPSGNVPELGGLGQSVQRNFNFPVALGGHGLAPGPEYGYYGPTYNIAYAGPGLGFGPESGLGPTNWYGPNIGAYNPVTPPGGKKTAKEPYQGLPPRVNRRPDPEIRAEILRRFAQDRRLDARRIGVQVTAGVVTLLGKVSSRSQRQRAGRDAEASRGVWAVHNHLQVPTARRAR